MADPGQDPQTDPKTDPDVDPKPDLNPGPDPDPTPDPTLGPDGKPFDPDRALKTIQNLRQREKDLESKVKAFEDKDKTEAQRQEEAKTAAETAAAQAKAETAQLRLQLAASAAGARNPETVAKLADLEAADGDAAAAIEALKASDDYLFGPGRGEDTGSAANPGRGKKEKLTRDKIAAMSYEEADARKGEIQAFFREQAGR